MIFAGKVGGLRGHRWLLMAIESKVVIHDMVSGTAREAVRTLWDGKAPTALGFLYANAARLLGFLAGDNANEVIRDALLIELDCEAWEPCTLSPIAKADQMCTCAAHSRPAFSG